MNEAIKQKISELSSSEIHLIESTHVSLSRTFVVRYHWISSFFSSLQEQFRDTSQFHLLLSPEIVYFSNDDDTRFFACILLHERCQQVVSTAIRKVDVCLKEFNLPTYYETPSVHISILWKLESFTEAEKGKISSTISRLFASQMNDLVFLVERISLKTGNKLMEISLNKLI